MKPFWEFQTDLKTNTNSNTFDQADVDLKANEKREGLSAHRLRGGRVIESRARVCAYPLPVGLIADVFVSVARHAGHCGLNPQSARETRHLPRGGKGFPQISVLISLRGAASH